MSMRYQAGIVLPGYNPLKVANAPTIGTATAGTANCASVTFTAPACVGGGAISSYTIFSNCGAKIASGASSPLVVTGLTTSSSYTFKAIATNLYGPSYPSAASNSITATIITCAKYISSGTFTWVAPAGVTSVSVVAVGGGGTALYNSGGGGGGLGYKNAISVTPSNSYTVVVGAVGGTSYFVSAPTVSGVGSTCRTIAASYTGDGGGNGGTATTGYRGGGGAGGYAGAGGNGAVGTTGNAGAGGGGGGGTITGGNICNVYGGGGGGGVGLLGQGSNGAGGIYPSASNAYYGLGGSGGGNGTTIFQAGGAGGSYGGGAGASGYHYSGCCVVPNTVGTSAKGAVRIVWCSGGARGTPSFPSTNVG